MQTYIVRVREREAAVMAVLQEMHDVEVKLNTHTGELRIEKEVRVWVCVCVGGGV